MSEKLFRWFKIIYVIQARPGISAKELAERCETEERTIYRDLRSLDVLAPITNEGYGKGCTFAGDFAMYPFNGRSRRRWSHDAPFLCRSGQHAAGI